MTILLAPTLALAAVLSAPLPQAPVADELARLVPADAVAIFRVESARAIRDLTHAFEAIDDPGARALTPAELLAQQFSLPGDTARILTDRPFAVVFTLEDGGPMPTPAPSFVLPVSDAQAYLASVGPEWASSVQGGYVGITLRERYEPPAAPSPLLGKLRPWLFSVGIDLERVVETYRPMIDQGLDQAETMFGQYAAMQPGPMDLDALLDGYVEVARSIVDSAELVEVGVRRFGSSVEIAGSFVALEHSPLAGFGSGAPLDLLGAARTLDPSAPLAMLVACDWADFAERFAPMLDAMLAAYPEPLGSQLREYMQGLRAVYPLMGPAVTVGAEFGPGGMRARYAVHSSRPDELVEAFYGTLARLSGGGIRVEELAPLELDGLSAPRLRVNVDLVELTRMLESDEAAAAVAMEREQIEIAMRAVYGENGLVLTLLPRANGATLVLGDDEAYVRAAAARPSGLERLPGDLRRAVVAANGSAAALVYRVDVGRFLEQFTAVLGPALGPAAGDLDAFPSLPLPFTWWAALRGRHWESGLLADLDQITAFARAAQRSAAGEEQR